MASSSVCGHEIDSRLVADIRRTVDAARTVVEITGIR